MSPHDIHIATIDTVEGCREHERLQNLVWGQDPPEAVPAHLLIAMVRHGGIVLGAYADGVMVGLLLSLPALHDGRLVHLSHLLGVHPGWRGHGIGAALKWRQRELALAQSIDTIVWTYDPLEAANARLNLAHLGGIVHTYARDYYGAMEDALNRGMPSDRFTLTWHLNAHRVRDRAAGIRPDQPVDAPVALGSQVGTGDIRLPAPFAPPTGATALAEIPAQIQQIKRQAPDAALAWRLATREACEQIFAAGYVATDVICRGERVFYYVEQTPHAH